MKYWLIQCRFEYFFDSLLSFQFLIAWWVAKTFDSSCIWVFFVILEVRPLGLLLASFRDLLLQKLEDYSCMLVLLWNKIFLMSHLPSVSCMCMCMCACVYVCGVCVFVAVRIMEEWSYRSMHACTSGIKIQEKTVTFNVFFKSMNYSNDELFKSIITLSDVELIIFFRFLF